MERKTPLRPVVATVDGDFRSRRQVQFQDARVLGDCRFCGSAHSFRGSQHGYGHKGHENAFIAHCGKHEPSVLPYPRQAPAAAGRLGWIACSGLTTISHRAFALRRSCGREHTFPRQAEQVPAKQGVRCLRRARFGDSSAPYQLRYSRQCSLLHAASLQLPGLSSHDRSQCCLRAVGICVCLRRLDQGPDSCRRVEFALMRPSPRELLKQGQHSFPTAPPGPSRWIMVNLSCPDCLRRPR